MFEKGEIYKIAISITFKAAPMLTGRFDLEKIREKIFSNNPIELNPTEKAIYEGALSVKKGEKYQISNEEESANNSFAIWCAIDTLSGVV